MKSDLRRRFQIEIGAEPVETDFPRTCSICHRLSPDSAIRAGPTLCGIFGRRAGSLPGHPYSQALRDSDQVWTEAIIARLLDRGPTSFCPAPGYRCSA